MEDHSEKLELKRIPRKLKKKLKRDVFYPEAIIVCFKVEILERIRRNCTKYIFEEI